MFFVTKIVSETFNLKQEVFCLASWSNGGTLYRHTCVWNLGKDGLTAALYPGVLTFILYEIQERADLISWMTFALVSGCCVYNALALWPGGRVQLV